ncbi:MAG TPA: BRO family protein [Flavobacteriales bacterium]|nr:BRO family protein [Flavobacteriales bacterium]
MNTQNLPSLFNFQQHQLRGLLLDHRPWFAAIDICKMLDIGDASQAARHLDDDEKQNLVIQGPGEQQGRRTLCVCESGAWALVMRSRKPEAKAIRKWLTGEVLPALHRTGNYSMAHAKEVTRPVGNPVTGAAAQPKALPGALPAGVLDARAVPTTTVGLRKGRVRMVPLQGKQWYSLVDVLKCLGTTTSSHSMAGTLPGAHKTQVLLFGSTQAGWFIDDLGLRLVLGAKGMLHSQLTINLD